MNKKTCNSKTMRYSVVLVLNVLKTLLLQSALIHILNFEEYVCICFVAPPQRNLVFKGHSIILLCQNFSRIKVWYE